MKQQETLIDNAENEYVDYLKSKNEADLQYIESSSSYNSQLINSMGEGYETDYNNWLNLLKDKELAYQRYLKAFAGDKNGDGVPDDTFIYDPTKSTVENLIANGKSPSTNNIIEAETAKSEYEKISKKYENLRDSLKFSPTIESDFEIDLDDKKFGSDSKSSSDTYFDHIETHLDHFNDKLDETKEKANDTFNGWSVRDNSFGEAIDQAKSLVDEYKEARARYEEEANKSGISESDKELIQFGAIQIDKLPNDDPRKEQFESYQKWWDKIKECDEAIGKLNKDLIQLYSDSREFRWEAFDYLEDSISRITNEANDLIDLLSNKDLFNDKGNLNEYGNATLALHASNIETYKQQAKDYLEEMKSLQKELANGGGQEVLDKYIFI